MGLSANAIKNHLKSGAVELGYAARLSLNKLLAFEEKQGGGTRRVECRVGYALYRVMGVHQASQFDDPHGGRGVDE